MRRVLPWISVALLAVVATGCGKAAPTGSLAVAPSAALPVEAPAIAPTVNLVSTGSANLVANNAASLQAPTGARYVELEEPPAGTPAELGDDPANISIASTDDGSYRIDERTPYGVVVVERSAHTATLAWRTDVPTKGLIQYGRTWGFDKNSFTDSYRDDVAKTDHKITITGLRRFTSYTFRVTAVTPLGLQFSDKVDRKFRTKFWSWR